MTDARGAALSGNRSLKLVIRLVSLVFVALCLAFVVHLLVRDWPETSAALRHARLWWLVPAAVCACGGMFLLAWRWGAAIIAVGGRPAGHHRVISAFFVGEAGKYIPGAVWAMLGRSELARREGLRTVDCLLQRGPLGHRLLSGRGPHRPHPGRRGPDRWFHQYALVAGRFGGRRRPHGHPSGRQSPDPRHWSVGSSGAP